MAIDETAATTDIGAGLRRLRTHWRRLTAVTFGAAVVGVSAGAAAMVLLVGSLLPPAAGPLLPLVWLALTTYAIARVWPRTLGVRPGLDDAAGRVEDTRPAAEGVLLGALQLDRRREGLITQGYDPGLLGLAVERGVDVTSSTYARDALVGERKTATKAAGLCALGAAALALVLSLGLASAEARRSWVTLPRGAPAVSITNVLPGATRVVAGETLRVTASLDRAPDAPVVIEARDVGGEWRQIAMAPAAAGYAGAIRSVVGPMEYRVRAGAVASETFPLSGLTPPRTDRLTLTLTFPEYTRLTAKTLEDGHGDVTALVGTRVDLAGAGGVPLASATVDFADGADIALTVDGSSFAGSFHVSRSDRYTIGLVSEDGLDSDRLTRYVVHAIPDLEPSVAIVVPGEDTLLDKSMLVPLTVEASDDFGVAQVTLHYRHDAKDATGTVRLATYSPARPLARVMYEWNLARLGLFAGDTVSYHVSADDNDTITGPKTAVSPTYTLRLPTLTEMFQQVSESQDAQTDMLGSLADAQDEVNDLVDSIMDRVRKNHELTLADEKELERALEMEEAIEQQRAEIAQEMAKALEEASRNSLLSNETLERVAEMHRLMDEVASEELKQAMQKLQDAMDQESMAAQERDLMAAEFNQEKFRERIEQMVQLLEKMKREQQLERAFQMAEALVEEQKKVVEETERLNRELDGGKPQPDSDEAADSDRLADREDALAEQTDALRDQLDTAEAALREDDDLAEVADEAQRLAAEMDKREISEQLAKAGGEFAKSDPGAAQPPASQALRDLQHMRQQLDNAMEFMRGQGGEALQAALTDAMREMLHLSRTHEGLADIAAARLSPVRGVAGGPPQQQDDLALGERTVADGVNAVASKLQALSQDDVQIPLEIMFHLRDAADAVQRSSMAFAEGQLQQAGPIQRDGLAKLNRVALEMLDALNALNAQMNGAGMQSMLDQMQQLAEGQGDLNQMTQQLEQMGRQQGQTPGMAESLRRMAFEQSLIRDAFQRLEEQMRAMEQGLGDLSGVEGEMESVARKLEAGEVDRELLERMQRIETRMLESAKALQKRQTGKSRKAKIAAQLFAAQVGTAPDEWDEVRDTFGEKLLRSADADAPEAYRSQVRAFFRALANTGGAPGE